MDFKNLSITSLIPQRPPFVMVDHVLSCDTVDAATEFRLRPDCIFLDGCRLSPSGIIENMAQSCAARMGCVNLMLGSTVKMGFIGDVRNCEIVRLPCVGETLTTHVHVLEDIFNLTLAEISVERNGETIACCTMKIATMDGGNGQQGQQ